MLNDKSEERKKIPPYSMEVDTAFEHFQSAPHGLSMDEVEARQQKFGLNQLPEGESVTVFRLFISQFLSPLIYVLLAAAVVSFFLEEITDALFILAALTVNAVIGTVQEYHAQNSARALRNMVSAQAMVLRQGESFEVDASELVPGDMVLLESGSKVPADIRLTHAFDLEVNESLLTGESLPVSKKATMTLPETAVLAERINMLFSGTMVNRGRGRGVVVGTGVQTEVGKLAKAMQSGDATKPPLIVRMEKFTLGIAVALALVIVILASVAIHNGLAWSEVFMMSVALAVSAIPEGLPVALTVALAISMNRMAKRHVIVRRLIAVEALGSCTVIASDKTGTLTMNELTVRQMVLPDGDAYLISGESHAPQGEVTQESTQKRAGESEGLQALARAAVLCNEGFLGLREQQWVSHGDAVDVALLMMAHKMGITKSDAEDAWAPQALIPYESEFAYAASLHVHEQGHLIVVKGALERLLPMCSSMMLQGKQLPLDTVQLEQQQKEMAEKGFRMLAFAQATLPTSSEPLDLNRDDLKNLTFLGLVGMIDPLRPEAKVAVEDCHRAGIRACMITGDHPATAFTIARELKLVERMDQVITGQMLRDASLQGDQSVEALVAGANVFARVEPSQKVMIVQALQRLGHFVAVTGDGANDAPALTVSHVGVAMGERGTDVAKESADLVIADDNFASIVAGVEEGRVAYRNIRKVIFLLISTGAAELVLFFLSLIFQYPLPLTAVQLLWLNLVTNGIQDVALAFEPREGNEMHQPPRKPSEPIFNRVMVERTLITAAVVGGVAFLLFQSLWLSGMPLDEARNSTLLLMVLFENIHAFNSRSESRSVFAHNPMVNPMLLFGTLTAQLIHIVAMYTPGLHDVLGIQPVSLMHWLKLLTLALTILLAMELYKAFRKSAFKG